MLQVNSKCPKCGEETMKLKPKPDQLCRARHRSKVACSAPSAALKMKRHTADRKSRSLASKISQVARHVEKIQRQHNGNRKLAGIIGWCERNKRHVGKDGKPARSSG